MICGVEASGRRAQAARNDTKIIEAAREVYIAAAESAAADEGDAWQAFAGFMQRVVAADAASLTQRLAGTFEPTEDLYRAATYAGELNEKVFDRAQRAGVIRA